jgi:hypothetical protein
LIRIIFILLPITKKYKYIMESKPEETSVPDQSTEVKQEATDNQEMLKVDEGPEMPSTTASDKDGEKPKDKPKMI